MADKKLSAEEKLRRRVLDEFKQGSFTSKKNLDFFLKEFTRGNLEIGAAQLPEVAKLLEKEVAQDEAKGWKVKDGKVSLLMKLKQKRAAKKLQKTTQQLTRIKNERVISELADRSRFLGLDGPAPKIAESIEIPPQKSAWLHPFHERKRKRLIAKRMAIDPAFHKERLELQIRELTDRKLTAGKIGSWFYSRKIKAAQAELNPREFYAGKPAQQIKHSKLKDLTQDKSRIDREIAQMRRYLNEGTMTRKEKKQLKNDLRKKEKLQQMVNKRIGVLNAGYLKASAKTQKLYDAQEQQKEIAIEKDVEIITSRQELLRQASERGKIVEKLLSVAPDNTMRKRLDAIVNGRQQQNVIDDSNFEQLLLDQGFSREEFDLLRQHMAAMDEQKNGKKDTPLSEEEKPEENVQPPQPEPVPENTEKEKTEPEAEKQAPEKDAPDRETLPEPEPEKQEETNETAPIFSQETLEPQKPDQDQRKPVINQSLGDYMQVTYDNGDMIIQREDREVSIKKTPDRQVMVAAKTKDNQETIPSIEDFRAIVKNYDSPEIALGAIRDDEFKARLLIAAELEGKKIANLDQQKDHSSAMQNLSAETRQQLEAIEKKRADETKSAEKEGTPSDRTNKAPSEEKPKEHRLTSEQLQFLEKEQKQGFSEEQRKTLTWEKISPEERKLLQQNGLSLQSVMKKEVEFLSELRGTLNDKSSLLGSSVEKLRGMENQEEAVNATVKKLEMADKIVGMSDEEYQKFQQTEEYKQFGSKEELGLLNEVRSMEKNKASADQKGKDSGADSAKALGRMLSFYRGTKDDPSKLKKVIARELNPKLKAQAKGKEH